MTLLKNLTIAAFLSCAAITAPCAYGAIDAPADTKPVYASLSARLEFERNVCTVPLCVTNSLKERVHGLNSTQELELASELGLKLEAKDILDMDDSHHITLGIIRSRDRSLFSQNDFDVVQAKTEDLFSQIPSFVSGNADIVLYAHGLSSNGREETLVEVSRSLLDLYGEAYKNEKLALLKSFQEGIVRPSFNVRVDMQSLDAHCQANAFRTSFTNLAHGFSVSTQYEFEPHVQFMTLALKSDFTSEAQPFSGKNIDHLMDLFQSIDKSQIHGIPAPKVKTVVTAAKKRGGHAHIETHHKKVVLGDK